MIGSFGMALRYSFGLHAAADGLDAAIARVLAAGFRTADIRGEEEAAVSTSEMGDASSPSSRGIPVSVRRATPRRSVSARNSDTKLASRLLPL